MNRVFGASEEMTFVVVWPRSLAASKAAALPRVELSGGIEREWGDLATNFKNNVLRTVR